MTTQAHTAQGSTAQPKFEHSVPTSSEPLFGRFFGGALLAVGPTATAWFLTNRLPGGALDGQTGVALWVLVVALWSPLPLMAPATILGDAAGEMGCHPVSGHVAAWRSFLRRGSSVRAEALMALVGWAAGVAYVLPHLT